LKNTQFEVFFDTNQVKGVSYFCKIILKNNFMKLKISLLIGLLLLCNSVSYAQCNSTSWFGVGNISSGKVEAYWQTTNSVGEDYEIEFGPTGFKPGNGIVISGTVRHTDSYNTVLINGLESGTSYDFYIT
jgi:hypothetical protein